MHNNVTLLLSQKMKHSFFKESVKFYESKLKPHCGLSVVEPKSEAHFKKLCDTYSKDHFVILLDEKGKTFHSVAFSKKWDGHITASAKSICFIIGGPYGFSDTPKSDLSLSLSDFTLNHEMVPSILCEQIYRAYSIAKGHPYHHA